MGQRIFFWIVIILLVLFAFAFDMSSLATFLGLLSAGLAVRLYGVLVAIGGHLLIFRKFRVRLGDRVQIAGVTGEVTNLGLIEFQLKEIAAETGQPTGRVVFFSNSYVLSRPPRLCSGRSVDRRKRPRLEHHSGLKLQSQLRRSRSANLIQRIEAAILAASGRCYRHLSRSPEKELPLR